MINCFDCIYNIDFNLIDECGVSLISESNIFPNQNIDSLDYECSDEIDSWFFDFENTFPNEYAGESYNVVNTSEITWGNFGNTTKTISLSGLNSHSHVTIEFDLYIIDSWDGGMSGSGPDIFGFNTDGTNYLNTTFANQTFYIQKLMVKLHQILN